VRRYPDQFSARDGLPLTPSWVDASPVRAESGFDTDRPFRELAARAPINAYADDQHVRCQGTPLYLERKKESSTSSRLAARAAAKYQIHAISDAKAVFFSILLNDGEAFNCPSGKRLIRRTKSARKVLGDKAYDRELRLWLKNRGTTFPTFEPQVTLSHQQKILRLFGGRLSIEPSVGDAG
jgi:hypothetical protein